jgi:hypothetical protein
MEKTVVCIKEPRGEHGLEGYSREKKYKAEDMGNYWRVWSDPDLPDYYEVCGPEVFKKYFNEAR